MESWQKNNQAGPNMQNAASNIVSPRRRAFYKIDEYVGDESRSVEFKRGVGFIQKELRQGVAKYMCGFINSAINGTLFVGIDDTGTVQGYSARHREADNIRQQIDEGFKDIQPPVFTKDYSVTFVPVYDNSGNKPILDQWVIEIRIEGANIGGKERLYETRHGAYMRRDGSLQGPLSASMIQEWTKRLYQGEIDKLKKNEANLSSELQRRQRDYDNLESQSKLRDNNMAGIERKHQAEVVALEEKVRQLKLEVLQAENQALKNSSTGIQQEIGEIKTMLSDKKNTKSKVCVIS